MNSSDTAPIFDDFLRALAAAPVPPLARTHYRVLAKIGAGGMGEVYKAEDTRLNRLVAVKRLPAATAADVAARRRLKEEARAASRLNHPGIVTIHALEESDDVDFIVMEYVEGETLAAALARGPLEVAAVLAIGVAVAEALEHAHAAGLVHRDIKPANIMITARGQAKVLDFGIAVPATASALGGTASRDTASPPRLMGTVPYMSPEQLAGEALDARADLFSLGATLYEAATGRRAFDDLELEPLIRSITSRDPPPPSGFMRDCPPGFDELVRRALARDRAARFQSGAELAAALRALGDAPRAPAVLHGGEPVVAVLPFADLSPERNQGHLCEGLADEICAALSRAGGVRVVARAATARLAREQIDLRAVARSLGATTIVDGSVRPAAGGALRIHVQLIEAETGLVRATEKFDRDTAAIHHAEEEIAQRVAGSLAAPAPPRRAGPSFEVYELYLRGRYFWNRRPGPTVWRALECFQEAALRDPGFAAAWAGIADVYSTLGSWEAGVLPHGEAQALARGYAARALEIEPSLAEARTTLAYVTLHYDGDAAAAEAGFRAALAVAPRYAAAHHWHAHALVAAGRFDAALAAGHRALAEDPGNLLLNVHLAWHWHFARKAERVREQAERVIAMDRHFHWGHYFAAWGAEASGDPTRAVDSMTQAVRLTDGDPVMLAGLGRALAVAGDAARARDAVTTLEARPRGADLFAYELALIQLALGDRAAAAAALGRARTARSGWLVYFHVDPRWDSVRGDPAFAAP